MSVTPITNHKITAVYTAKISYYGPDEFEDAPDGAYTYVIIDDAQRVHYDCDEIFETPTEALGHAKETHAQHLRKKPGKQKNSNQTRGDRNKQQIKGFA